MVGVDGSARCFCTFGFSFRHCEFVRQANAMGLVFNLAFIGEYWWIFMYDLEIYGFTSILKYSMLYLVFRDMTLRP